MFKGMFRSSFLENVKNEIDLSHIFTDVNMANVFIDYLYTGRILLSDHNIEAILEAAHMTLMENLQNHCVQFLLHRLSVANVISTMRLAERYDITRLIEVCDSLLQRSEDLLVLSPEIAKMKSRNFLAFLNTEIISSYQKQVRSGLILCWLSVNIQKRAVCLEGWLQKNSLDKEAVGSLPLSSRKKRDLNRWLDEQKITVEIPPSVMNETSNDELPLIGNWTVVVQSCCGKTGFYCPELRKWHVLNLPVIDGDILGILNGEYLAYLEVEINAIAYIHMPSGTIKRTSIPGSCPYSNYKNCDIGSAYPYHYFCRHGLLYGINPITSSQNIVGWGVYRYFIGEDSGWQLLGDTLFSRDFDRSMHQRSEVMMSPIYDSTGYVPEEPIVYIFLQEVVSTGNLSITFLYNHQVREYYSFTACKVLNQTLNIFVLPEVVFVARFNTVVGLNELPAVLNFTEEDSSSKVDLSYQNVNCSLKSSESISLTIPKPSHLPLRYAGLKTAVSSTTDKKTTPLCPFTSSKQVVLFDGNIYLSAHLTPLDYKVMIYDLNNYPKGNLPPVPFATNREMRMAPIRTAKPISSVIAGCTKTKFRNSNKGNYTERVFIDWVFSSWKGEYKIVTETDTNMSGLSDDMKKSFSGITPLTGDPIRQVPAEV